MGDGEPTLCDIFVAVTSCNVSISALTDEINGVKAAITFMRHDMQKLWERASALEGRVGSIEDDLALLHRDVSYNTHLTAPTCSPPR